MFSLNNLNTQNNFNNNTPTSNNHQNSLINGSASFNQVLTPTRNKNKNPNSERDEFFNFEVEKFPPLEFPSGYY
jgi:hypothetical protein